MSTVKPIRWIGLTGKAGSGKNTFAGLLASLLVDRGYSVHVDAFACGVKATARLDHGWNGKKDEAGRKLLQDVGMRCRKIEPLCWIRNLLERVTDSRADFAIITDVRFDNEAEIFSQSGNMLISIEGRGGLDGDAAAHESERGVNDCFIRFSVNNDSDLDCLKDQAESLIEYSILRGR